jgi:formamidopyrimidine-DNA glycosylase
MPELPEVESLAAFLRGHATGHTVARADAASFSVLKTFDPPLTDLSGQVITEVGRHGKFLDLATDQGLHLIMHLARAGWLRWRDDLPTAPPKPGKSPLAFRLRLDDGSGFDLTEQGSHKRLAVYLVRDPAEVPGVATLGPDPLAADFTRDTLAGLLSDLDANHPGLRGRLVTEDGGLHRFVNVYVNDEDVRFLGALDAKLNDGDSVTILPAVAGGAA